LVRGPRIFSMLWVTQVLIRPKQAVLSATTGEIRTGL
jgi:hypothetical protein